MNWTVPGGDPRAPDDSESVGEGARLERWGTWRGVRGGLPVLAYNVSIGHANRIGAPLHSHVLAVELPRTVPSLVLTPAAAQGPIRRLLRHLVEDRRGPFHVAAADADFAALVLTPATLAWLAELPIAAKLPLRFEDRQLRTGGPGLLGPPEVTGSSLDLLVELYHRIPAGFWAQAT